MSRSGYSDHCEQWGLIRWRGAVASSITGKRGQQALREILAALDQMPAKELAAESLVTADGSYCTLGALGVARGISMENLDPEDPEMVAAAFQIAPAIVREIVYENDEREWKEKPAARWQRMHGWVLSQIRQNGD